MTQEQVSEILDRVAAAYTGCSSYRDSGESVTVFVRGPLPADKHTSAL